MAVIQLFSMFSISKEKFPPSFFSLLLFLLSIYPFMTHWLIHPSIHPSVHHPFIIHPSIQLSTIYPSIYRPSSIHHSSIHLVIYYPSFIHPVIHHHPSIIHHPCIHHPSIICLDIHPIIHLLISKDNLSYYWKIWYNKVKIKTENQTSLKE